MADGKPKSKGGRPATGKGTLIGVRFQPDMLAALDALIDRQPDPKPSRPEAVRQLLATAFNMVARYEAGR